MLTSDLFSPRASSLIVKLVGPTDQLTGEASFSCRLAWCSAGAYSFPSFHIRSTIAAIRRAIVSWARFGFVPSEVSLR